MTSPHQSSNGSSTLGRLAGLVLVLLLLGTSVALRAESVSYAVSGVFNCTNVAGSVAGCGTLEITLGSPGSDAVKLTYVPDSTATINLTSWSNITLGSLVTSCVGPCSLEYVPSGLGLSLSVTQNSSISGNMPVATSNVNGNISGGSSSLWFTWPLYTDPAGQPLILGDVGYRIRPSGEQVFVPLPGSLTVGQIQGTIQLLSYNGTNPEGGPPPIIPEPATLPAVAAAIGVAFFLRRRSSSRA